MLHPSTDDPKTVDDPHRHDDATLPPAESPSAEAPPASVPGYDLLAEVGRGGMGVVYKAQHQALNRVVALKMILAGGHAGPAELARFRQEAETVARLSHPNIVQVYEVGAHAGLSYLALEYVEGGSLAQKTAGVPHPPRDAARLIELLARAVDSAHQAGVVHRDITPGNVLLTADGAPKLSDFGLARSTRETQGLTATGAIVGTPGYLSPEQARGGKDIGPATDVWALGAVLYQLLTGRPPFQAAAVMDVILQTIEREPVSLRVLQQKVPADLETICLKCLRKEPGRRYGSAAELADDLRRFQADEPIRARPVGRAERAFRWVRRNPVVAGLLAAVAASLLGGALFAMYFAVEANARALEAELESERANDSARDARRNLAQAHLHLADTALRDGDPGQALSWLWHKDTYHPLDGPPGFEFWQLDRQCRPELDSLAHDGPVNSVAFSPDGRFLATASEKGVHVWDVRSRREAVTLPGGARHVAYHPDGRRVVAAHEDNLVRVWDVKTGLGLHTLKIRDKHRISSAAFSPDGKRLATASMEYSAEMDPLVWEVLLRDAETGQIVHEVQGRPGAVGSVAFSPDGRFLTLPIRHLPNSRGRVEVRDAATGRWLRNLECHDNPLSVAFSHDGRVAVACGAFEIIPGEVEVFDPNEAQLLYRCKGHAVPVSSVAFSPDGKRLASASDDKTVKVWDAATGRDLYTFRDVSGVSGVAFSPDGRLIASGGGGKNVKLWDANGVKEPRLLAVGHTQWMSLTFSIDSRRLAVAGQDNTMRILDAVTCLEVARFSRREVVAFSRDGRLVATAGEDGSVGLWDATTGRKTSRLPGPVTDPRASGWRWTNLAFTEDGKRLVGAGGDGATRTWDLSPGQEMHRTPSITSAREFWPQWTQGGRYVVAGLDDSLSFEIRNASTGELVHRGKRPRGWELPSFSPGGQLYAMGSMRNADVEVYDTETGRKLRTLLGHSGGVRHISFSHNEKRLATCGNDKTIRIWDLEREQLLRTLHTGPAGASLSAFGPDGHWLASIGGGDLELWDGRPLSPDLRAEREARAWLGWLFADPDARPDVAARLRDDPTFSERARPYVTAMAPLYLEAQVGRAADGLVQSLRDRLILRQDVIEELRRAGGDTALRQKARHYAECLEDDPPRLNEGSWKLVSKPGRGPAEYRQAVKAAEAACRLEADNGNFLNTLGVAYYRAGQWQLALETLTRSEPINAKADGKPHPADLAFLAMACRRLGQDDKARLHLERLREAVKLARWAKDKESQAFLREAEEVLAAKPAEKAKP